MPRPAKKPSMLDGRRASVLAGFLRSCDIQCSSLLRQAWPDTKYYDDPVGFVRNVLREKPLPHQEEILRAVAGKRKMFAIRSGRRVGKSKLVVWLALWWYCTRPAGSRVVMTATTEDQINTVLWTELKLTIWKAVKMGFQIEAPGPSCKSGLHSEDMRSIFGLSAGNVEALAGIAGPELLFIVDEASSLEQDYLEVIEGNMAGGRCKLIMISNPTRGFGPFYDAFHSKSAHYVKFHVNSETLALWVAEQGLSIPGIVDLEWIQDQAEKYPKDSYFWFVHVRGDFCIDNEGRIIKPLEVIEAQKRWEDTEGVGDLALGVDPAGEGDGGDEWGFAAVRGKKCLTILTRRGLSIGGAVSDIEALIKAMRHDDEVPRIMVDSEGPIGAELLGELQARSQYLRSVDPKNFYEVYSVKASKPATREPQLYERTRDELWAGLSKWLKDGGAIPKDGKLETELVTPGFTTKIAAGGAKLSATPKKAIREQIGRSPDRADALALAVWDPAEWLARMGLQTPAKAAAEKVRESTLPDDYDDDDFDGVIDPYNSRGKPDPYN